MSAVPRSLFAAVSGGIGLFIAFIGLKDAGVIVADPGTTVGLGKLTGATPALAILGLLVIAALQVRAVKAAILIGILTVAAVAWIFGSRELHARLAITWRTCHRPRCGSIFPRP